MIWLVILVVKSAGYCVEVKGMIVWLADCRVVDMF